MEQNTIKRKELHTRAGPPAISIRLWSSLRQQGDYFIVKEPSFGAV
ncbi:MAG: hypothetical protein H7Y18_06145 [Clostridiaceae bacterium]|nr:hypothetical protein [Clostridiaceae bacterium]